MTGALMEIVAYGTQNTVSQIKKKFVIDLKEFEMEFKKNNDLNDYSYELNKITDQYKLFGLIIELDDDNTLIDWNILLSKMMLDIYSYNLDKGNKIEHKKNYIGSIPLIISEIKHYKNSILIKFPNFFTNNKYFCNFTHYNFVIKSNIKFKNIFIQCILRFNDSYERKIIAMLVKIFAEFTYQYAIKTINPFIKSINNDNNIISFEKKIINNIENIQSIYFIIPIELIPLLNSVELKIENNINLINFDDLENKYKVEEKYLINLYRYDFDLLGSKLESSNIYIKFNFNLNLENLNLEEYIQLQSNNIEIFSIIENKLVYIYFTPKLKYINGIINPEFDSKEKDIINECSGNINIELVVKKIVILDNNIVINEELYKCIIEYLTI